MRVYIKNQQRLIKVNQHRIKKNLRKALQILGLHNAEISILFVNDRRMKILNCRYRGVDRTTDVLSFPQHSPREQKCRSTEATSKLQSFRTSELLLGDIVINLHQAKRQAIEHNLTFNDELRYLLIHGLLHLIGYDHEKGSYARRKMQKKTLELREKLQEKLCVLKA